MPAEPATVSAPPPAAPGLAAPPLIELREFSVALGGRPILHALTGELRGRAIGLLGPNGAGKTTLIHSLLGFHRASGGSARLLGRDVAGAGPELRAALGYMPERDAFIAGMSGVQFLRFMGELSGLPPQAALERAHEALFYVGLGEVRYRPIETYSSGMKQLAKLAQAIVHGPRLIFLDEPTNALDPAARQRMIRLIREIRDGGEARIVLSSHLLRDVEDCCDEILILRAGRIAACCNLEDERRTNRKFLLMQVCGGAYEPFVADLTAAGCTCALAAGAAGLFRLRVVLPAELGMRDLYRFAAQHQVQIRRLEYKRDSLEEIFLRAVEPEAAALAAAPAEPSAPR